MFNHRKQLLNNLMDLVSGGVNLCRDYNGNLNMYYGSKKEMSLAVYVYCFYHGIDLDKAVLSNNIRHGIRRNKLIENCRKDNLYLGGTSIYADDENKCVVALSNTDKFKDTFEPLPIITDILSGCISIQSTNGDRVMANYHGELFPVGDLAYLAYYDEDLTVDNFIEKRQALKRYKEINGLSLEHLDGDFHNHQKYNIALVKENLNSQKNDKISRIIEPYCFTVVYDKPLYSGIESEGFFKILTGVFEGDLMIDVEKHFITDCFENVVNLLDIYIAEYPERVDKKRAIHNERWIFNPAFAKILAREPNEKFLNLDTLHIKTVL